MRSPSVTTITARPRKGFGQHNRGPRQGKSEKTLQAYNYRLGFFLDFTARNNLRYLYQIDRKQLLRYVKFL
jgi:hypothetical protein